MRRTGWRFVVVLVLASVAVAPVQAEFADVARAIGAQRGVSRTWIPFLGVARVLVRAVEPKGVRDFQLAVFEGTDRMDPREVEALLAREAGRGFVPIVRVWSLKSSDWNFVYARPSSDSNRIEMLVLAKDDEETTLVRVVVDASVLARELSEPKKVSRMARR